MSIYANSNLSAAWQFIKRGWSIIPLWGSRSRSTPKAPALASWKDFQYRFATSQEIDYWFRQKQYHAMGIVLGSVSRLAVVDIDDPDMAERFKAAVPDLTQTFTVQSGNRALPHYYFQVPEGVSVPSRRSYGVELRSDGQYVVAPGTVINDRSWKIVSDVSPRTLTQGDLSRLLAFFERFPQAASAAAAKPLPEALTPILNADVASQSVNFNTDNAAALYRKLAHGQGRNQALFTTARYARNAGWSQDQVQEILCPAHVMQPPNGQHPRETAEQRMREAIHTIASVFTRPAQKPHYQKGGKQLPNTVREKLLQLKLVNVARVLDALLMAGFDSGQHLTGRIVYEAVVQFGIGRNTVFQVLKTALADGQRLFEWIGSVSPLHPPSSAIAAKDQKLITKQCLFGRDSKPGKIRGRKEHVVLMPSIEALCEWLEVEDKGGDNLQPEDLKTPAVYRAALHAALIRRAPGQYPRQWLAQRLSVCKTSCRRYDRRQRIRVTPRHNTYWIDWQNVDRILREEPFPGTFLEDENGKRYPALPAIARQLLLKRQKVAYKWQDVNDYRIDVRINAEVHHSVFTASQPETEVEAARWTVQSASEVGSQIPGLTSCKAVPVHSSQSNQKQTQDSVSHTRPSGQTKKTASHRCCSTQSNTQAIRACADALYTYLHTSKPDRSLTRRYALNLVKTYGIELVQRGMRVLAKREQIRNPAGFLTVWLRCENPQAKLPKTQKRKPTRQGTGTPASVQHDMSSPKRYKPDNQDWLERLKASPYARFLDNAADLLD